MIAKFLWLVWRHDLLSLIKKIRVLGLNLLSVCKCSHQFCQFLSENREIFRLYQFQYLLDKLRRCLSLALLLHRVARFLIKVWLILAPTISRNPRKNNQKPWWICNWLFDRFVCDLGSILAPLGPILACKIGPTGVQEPSKMHSNLHLSFDTVLDQFLVDFGSNLELNHSKIHRKIIP